MSEIAEILHREFVYIWYYFDVQLRQIFGYWAIGILLGSCISVFLKERIHGLLRSMNQSRMGLLGIVPASLLGIASPLCMYGTIPLAASFSRSGMREEWLASFMMCSILLNPQLIVYSTALGTMALVVRIVSCFFCGIAAGLLLRAVKKGKPFFRFDSFAEPVSHDTDPHLLIRLVKNVGRNEHGQCGGFYDYRSLHQDYQSGCFKNRTGNEKLYALSCLCNGVFFLYRPGS